MSFASTGARNVGVPDVVFFTASAAGLMGYMQFEELVKRGLVPLKGAGYKTNGSLDAPVDWVPGMKGMRLGDMPTFCHTTDADSALMRIHLHQMRVVAGSKAVVINTFHDMEKDVVDALAAFLPPVYTVGPLSSIEAVLAHPAVGLFVTHCGWNSILETVIGGVPVLGWPMVSEQTTNCRQVSTAGNIGAELPQEARGDEIAALVREMMVGEKGIEAREKTLEWKRLAEDATKEGGSSCANLDRYLGIPMHFRKLLNKEWKVSPLGFRPIDMKESLVCSPKILIARTVRSLGRGLDVAGSLGAEVAWEFYTGLDLRRVIPYILLMSGIHGGGITRARGYNGVYEMTVESCFYRSRWE
uniref:Cyanohydrin beta-glucosyltransferase n=1 Tax=Aegilops tauschii TaxID=37682 RepID=M8CC56_AEGTA